MEGYLGETNIVISEHPIYSKYTQADWAMLFIEMYGQFHNQSAKSWVLDQVARILKGTPVTVKTAAWANGQTEDRYSVSKTTSFEYNEWRESMRGEIVDGEYEYDYEQGSPP